MFVELFNIILLVVSTGALQLPPIVEQCYRDDPNISKCVLRNIENLKSKAAKGIPSLHVPPLNPLTFSSARIQSDRSFKVDLENVNLYDIDKCAIINMNIQLGKLTVEFEIECKEIILVTDYAMKGKILILELDNHGHANASLYGIKTKIHFDLGKITKNGKDHLTITSSKWDLHIDRYFASFDNLIGDNKELNEAAQKILNNNYGVLLEEFTPMLSNIMKDVFTSIHQGTFMKYPLDVLFPKKNI